jgi:hypothetical protein
MNRLADKFKMILLIVPLIMTFAVHAGFDPAQVQQIATAAAKLQFSSQENNPSEIKTVEDIVEKTLLAAIADPERMAEITKAFVTANPNAAVAITYAVAKLFPDRAVKIVTTAIAAAPDEMAKITTAAVAAAPQLAGAIIKAVVGVAVISPSHVFVQSESVVNNSAVKQNVIVSALENTLKNCTNDQCKIAAAVLAMSQGASSPDLAGSLAGEIIRTVITINPQLQAEIIKIVENKQPASPN